MIRFFKIAESTEENVTRFTTARSLRRRSIWFIKLRWIAAFGAVLLSIVAKHLLNLPLDLHKILAIVGLLALTNIVYFVFNRNVKPKSFRREETHIKTQMILDLLILTILMHFTGGVENPLFFIYFFHVIMASLMFKGKGVYQIAFLAILFFTFEVVFSTAFFPLLNHYHIFSHSDHMHDIRYVLLMLLMFWFVILATAFIAASFRKRYQKIKDELVKNQEQLIETDKSKTDFFRFASHELKSPIVTIQSAIDTVLDISDLSNQSKDLLYRARNRAEQTIETVRDLAELTRNEATTVIGADPIRIGEMIQNIVEQNREPIQQCGLDIHFVLPEKPIILRSFPGFLEKIFGNLISNAIRYSHDGGAIIIRLVEKLTSVEFSISDEGIGISEDAQQMIFSEFYRAPEAKKHNRIGTGLGLAIVKQYVEKLGGTIQLKSQLGKGTTFKITLPTNV